MTDSISSAASASLPVPFVLNRFVPNEATQRRDELAKHRAALQKARYETELLAAEYAQIMLERHINAALDKATDPALAARLRVEIMNRGLGRVKTVEEDSDDNKKAAPPLNDFLEFLANCSAASAKRELGHTPAPRIERDIPADLDGHDKAAWKMLDALDGDDHE